MNELVENYFLQRLSPDEKEKFEAEIKSNPELAHEVALYLATKQLVSDQARSRKLADLHAAWQTRRPGNTTFVALRTWYAVAAAIAMIAFGLLWYVLISQKPDLQELASGYALENFTTLSVQMGDGADSIQQAIGSYNNGQYATSTKICEQILIRDANNAAALKVAGIVSLKLLDYDKAITYFQRLGEQPNLYANPGKFYEAIALLQSGLPLNKKKAEELLKEVISSNLDGKEEAEKWLK